MARDRRAFIGSGMWLEESIRSLTRLQQQAYLLAYTQPDVNRCGVLSYRLRSWEKTASDATIEELHRDFLDLHNSRHVVLDEDEETLLIRTYVKHDGLLTQPLVVAAMIRDFFTISSKKIRIGFLAEMRRLHSVPLEPKERQGLALALGADPACHDVKNAATVAKAIGSGLAAPMVDAITAGHVDPYPEKGLPEGLPEGYRQGLTTGPTGGLGKGSGNPPPDPQGQSRIPVPVPVPVPVTIPVPVPAPTDDDPPPQDDPTSQLLAEHAAAYATPPPPSSLHPVKTAVMRLVAEGTHPDHIRAGLTRMRDKRLSARHLPELVAEAIPTRGGRTVPADRNAQILHGARARAQAAEAQQARKAIP